MKERRGIPLWGLFHLFWFGRRNYSISTSKMYHARTWLRKHWITVDAGPQEAGFVAVSSTPPTQCRQLLPISAVCMCPSWIPPSILHTCQESWPLEPIPRDRPPHSVDQVLSFYTSICPSLCLSIHPTAVSFDASTTSYQSLGWRDDPAAHLRAPDFIAAVITLHSESPTPLKPSGSTTLAPAVWQW